MNTRYGSLAGEAMRHPLRLALLALAVAPGPVFAQVPPVPTSVNPSVVTKGTCPGQCALDVAATNVVGPTVQCRFRQRNPPNEVLADTPSSYTSTNVLCNMHEPNGPRSAGLWDLALTNDGATYSSASVELTVECPAGQFGDDCTTCFCQALEFCNDGWDGDGFCSECPDGDCNPACSAYCQCNGSSCEFVTEPPYCTACICNDGRYGTACESTCPGGEDASQCNGNGACDDGVNGTGECSCTNDQFWGLACEDACSGNCLDAQCRQSDGTCLACPLGWTGDLCDQFICSCDFNGDQQIDLQDHDAFVGCFGGPDVSPSPPPPATVQQCLDAFDVDLDSDVDLSDLAGFFLVFGNP